MLSLRGSISSGRRDFLRVGGLGLGGISLADMLEFKARASENGVPLRDKAVVFLFMHGGPPQAETFDPKMDAPNNVRSQVGEVKTNIPGITYGSTLQRLAGLADKISVYARLRLEMAIMTLSQSWVTPLMELTLVLYILR